MTLALLVVVVLSAPASPAGADSGADSGAVNLERRIGTLRGEARYAEAVAVAESLLALRTREGDSIPAADAERLVATLRTVAALPAAERDRLAEADRATDPIEEHYGRGEYAKAGTLAEIQLATRVRILGERHEDVAECLNNLGAIRKGAGEYAEAESLYARVLAIQDALLPEGHLQIAQTVNNRASLHLSLGRYGEAEAGFRRSLEIRRRRLPPEDPAIARAIQSVAMALEAEGDFADVEPLLRESLAIKRKTLGEKNSSYLKTLMNLALVLDRMGEPSQAAVMYRKSLATLHEMYGEDHPDVVFAREQLAMHLEEQGDCEAAREIVTETLAASRRILGPDHPEVAKSLTYMATILRSCGDEEEAERLNLESYRILVARLGADHPSTLTSLASLARTKDQIRANAEAESLYAIVLDTARRIHPPDHPSLARAALNVSISLRKLGQYERATPLMEEAIAIRRRSFGEKHPALARALSHYGHLWLLRGDYDRAAAALAEAAAVFELARLRVDPGLERVTFLEAPHTQLAAVELLRGRPEAAWPAVEADRGRALSELLVAADLRVLTAEEREMERALTRELADRERAVEALQEAKAEDSLREKARGRLLESEARWSAFEREAASRHPVAEGQVFPLERVQAALPPSAAIVGWLDAPFTADSTLSWAYVVRSSGPVRWARVASLGAAERDQPAWLDSLRTRLRDPAAARESLRDGNTRLWKARFAPIEDALDGVEKLIVVPTGPTAGLPIEGLIDANGRYLTDRFAISYAPSSTVFAWLTERSVGRAGSGRSLLVGDPPFTEAQLASIESAGAGAPPTPPRTSERLLRGERPGTADVLASLPRLPGTRAEVAAIDSALGSAHGTATILLGPEAREEEIIRRAESAELAEYDVLHFATHALIDDRRPERSALVLSQVGLPDPLVAALAGGRIVDGLVSAKEVLREWRLDADLVTLSACESGLGKELRGEGTVGFAHAFFQAGARSVLVSLWRVDDRATALLMRRFYENRGRIGGTAARGASGAPMSKAEALREAKRWLRDYRTASGRSPFAHPYYWSSFILIGDAGIGSR